MRAKKALGGILLTASHNPGGIDADFGIKFNCANGGPAPSAVTDKIYEISKTIVEFKAVNEGLEVNLDEIGTKTFDVDGTPFDVEVVDSTAEYFTLMKELFDFEAIKSYLQVSQKEIILDSMNGVTGPYCTRLQKELALSPGKGCQSLTFFVRKAVSSNYSENMNLQSLKRICFEQRPKA